LERSIFGQLSHWLLTGFEKVQKAWFRWADLNQHAAWFPLAIAATVALDAVIVVLPGDVIVALAIISNAGAWKKTAAWSGLGSGLGAFALYLLVLQYGKAPLDQLAVFSGATGLSDLSGALSTGQPDLEAGISAMGLQDPPTWATAREFFNKHGLVSLAFGSVIPFFSWPLVIIAGVSSDRWWEVLFWLLLGRQARYWILGFGLREGWAMFQALREEAQVHREQKTKALAAGVRHPKAKRGRKP
jgi:membrane protein YqaA with SNARE-associated domain